MPLALSVTLRRSPPVRASWDDPLTARIAAGAPPVQERFSGARIAFATGREVDPETGLYYYRARYYDSTTGRFLQKDPIGLNDGLNLYRYVRNNPINLIDPDGLTAECPDCVERCLKNNYGDLADLAYQASIFGFFSTAGLAITATSIGIKAGIGGGIGGGAQIASNYYASEAARILSTPTSQFSKLFGLEVRGALADAALSTSQRFASVSKAAFALTKGAGIVGAVLTVGTSAFYGTARAYCELQCLGE